MGLIVALDATPLNLASKPRGRSDGDDCRAWLIGLCVTLSAVSVVVEIRMRRVREEFEDLGHSDDAP